MRTKQNLINILFLEFLKLVYLQLILKQLIIYYNRKQHLNSEKEILILLVLMAQMKGKYYY